MGININKFWFLLQVNMKMREMTEREHKVKHHPLESPSHQKVIPFSVTVQNFINFKMKFFSFPDQAGKN